MTTYAHQAQHVKRPSIVDIVAWLWRVALVWLLAAYHHALHQVTAQPRHALRAVRAASGADERYPAELHEIVTKRDGDREYGLYSGDLWIDAVTQTGQWTTADYEDAWPTMPSAYAAPVDAATEVAFTAAVRQAGGES